MLVFLLGFPYVRAQLSQDDLDLTYETGKRLSSNPLECYNKAFPYKFSQVLNSTEDVKEPQDLVPIFYGCFDWHSSVHGHWLLAAMLNRFPDTPLADEIVQVFNEQFQEEKLGKELEFFKKSYNKHFERTYGWAWFLKLHQELKNSPLDQDYGWSATLKPLADHIVVGYKKFLPNLVYPIRVGEHSNTAFGLIFAYEYALDSNDDELIELIRFNATSLFSTDEGCPLTWEPSGYDFLSPCLQEADLMGRISQDPVDFAAWLNKFLPQLFQEDFILEPGEVIDRTDGKLVHLDGLNFSRGWNLYALLINLSKSNSTSESIKAKLMSIADEHLRKSMEFVIGGDYAGSHWLASFLTYALQMREKSLEEF